ncbi:hypothetical protein ABWH96_17320 [Marivirga tractuosa]|uniref:hypothetical protein n=1 Tax=Marivirga tractuosa TaxID=1006 RepID=UPI0035CFBDB3
MTTNFFNRIKISQVLLTFAVVFLVACTEDVNEELKKKDDSIYKIINNRYEFDHLEDFHNLISTESEDKLKEISDYNLYNSFISFSERNYNRRFIEEDDEDEIIYSLLNENGVIQIQNKLFQLNFDDETVLVYQNEEELELRKPTRIYSFEEEVLSIEFDESYDENDTQRLSYCSSKNSDWIELMSSSQGIVEYRLRYLKLGIYYSVTGKIRKNSRGGAVNMNIETQGFPIFFRNKRSCYGNSVSSSAGGYNQSYKIKPYASTRRLKAYNFRVYVSASDGQLLTSAGAFATISCRPSDSC